MDRKILEIKNLKTYFFLDNSGNRNKYDYEKDSELKSFYESDIKLKNKIPAKAVDDVSFDIFEGEVLGIVGESGAGKSVTAYSITRLIPDPPGKIAGGEIIYKGVDILKLSYDELKKYRGAEISMIFQEPMTSLNPVLRISAQITEAIFQHNKISHKDAFARAIDLLNLAGIPDAENRIKEYPHQFSGGMRQRVMIAMALACNPSLLIADEPTTALDVTIQAQIIDLMLKIKNDRKESAILLITHNLGVIAEMCNRVIVMYGGKIQEIADVKTIFSNPKHPYTIGLLESIPDSNKKTHTKLKAIDGTIPHILDLPKGCKFCTRCNKAFDKCFEVEPELKKLENGHKIRCHLY
jgi:oligopeptide/dipeptide ABC transporter ATP-binding protein